MSLPHGCAMETRRRRAATTSIISAPSSRQGNSFFATDAYARAKFRQYWSFLSPGIIVIRWASLHALKSEAERRFDAGREAW
jgi:hypothetical protein